ncbi:hypothetical protein ZIOFF_057964 [Zingiber officinale]|uniref:Chloroplastic group IIB intron splicing facilitator CRS2, chloroplastic n=1 Tax=Zingiber officinale TaxID=94328 RepID=A0A8J5F7J3_ZINOF|nr:hypothetical protein ZIOFF_057964 [Zingiber officinale]
MASLAGLSSATAASSPSSSLPLRSPIPCEATTRRRHLLLPSRCNRFRRAVASLPDPNERTNPEYTPWLIAGLGNPGNKYHGTRHNVGFEMIDHISRAEGITLNSIQSKALIGIGSIGEVPILLVGPLAAYYQVPLRHILLMYDEMSLPNGVLRVQRKGGHGHHNGCETTFDTTSPRANSYTPFNVAATSILSWNAATAPPSRAASSSSQAASTMDSALEQGVDAVRTLVFKGFSENLHRFNLVQKYKYHKV